MIIECRCPFRWAASSGDATALACKDKLVHGRRCLRTNSATPQPIKIGSAPARRDHVTCREHCSGRPRGKQIYPIATGQWYSHGTCHHAYGVFIPVQIGHNNGNTCERDTMTNHGSFHCRQYGSDLHGRTVARSEYSARH